MAPRKEPSEMSAFERRRLDNIAANTAILTELSTTAQKIIPDKPKPSRATKSTKPRRSMPARETSGPVRTSSRLAGKSADDDSLKRKFEVETMAEAEKAKARKMRIADDLNLGDIVVNGKKWGSGFQGIKGIVRGAEPGVRTFTQENIKQTTNEGLKDLRLRMGRLKLYEAWEPNDIKLTPQRIYALGLHPTEDKPVVFAGDKEGAVGVFDGSQTAPDIDDDDEDAAIPYPAISAFQTHARTITSFVFSPVDANAVFTSSYDSSIRKMDLEKGVSVQIYAPADPEISSGISALDMADSEPNVFYFSTLDGTVGQHDMRIADGDETWILSESKIGGFSLHPLQPHLLVTASLDRTMKIWDLRMISGKGDLRHPALLGEHASRLSVSHASWSPGGHIATSSYDDTIKIYDFSDASSWKKGSDISAKTMEPGHRVPHNNQTGRWVTILKPHWQKRPRDGIQKFVIGNMNRFVDVYASDGSQLAQLYGDGITAVPAVAHFHPTMDWVAGGTASGKLCLWQ